MEVQLFKDFSSKMFLLHKPKLDQNLPLLAFLGNPSEDNNYHFARGSPTDIF